MTEPAGFEDRITLPLLPATNEQTGTSAPSWHGWRPADLLSTGAPRETDADSPEPVEPQGEYGSEPTDWPILPVIEQRSRPHPVELLAPAGGPEAGFAAFHFGADAIYL